MFGFSSQYPTTVIFFGSVMWARPRFEQVNDFDVVVWQTVSNEECTIGLPEDALCLVPDL